MGWRWYIFFTEVRFRFPPKIEGGRIGPYFAGSRPGIGTQRDIILFVT